MQVRSSSSRIPAWHHVPTSDCILDSDYVKYPANYCPHNEIKFIPAGQKILQKYAGCNASKIFNKYHTNDIPEKVLKPVHQLGVLKGDLTDAGNVTESGDYEKLNAYRTNVPRIGQLLNLNDFEHIARHILQPIVWCFYAAAAEDEVTYRENINAYGRIFFKPYVCRDVRDIDLSTEMLGSKLAAPFYCSAYAQTKLGHCDGELGIARGCGKEGITQMISSNASYPMSEIAGQVPGQVQWFQLYTSDDRQVSLNHIKDAEQRGMKGILGIFVTVDSSEVGRREKHMRVFAEPDLNDNFESSKEARDYNPHGRAFPVTEWIDKKKTSILLSQKSDGKDL